MIRAKSSALDEHAAIALSNCFVRDYDDFNMKFERSSKAQIGKHRMRLFQRWTKELENLGCVRTVGQIRARVKGDLAAVNKRIMENRRNTTGSEKPIIQKFDTARQIMYDFLDANWDETQHKLIDDEPPSGSKNSCMLEDVNSTEENIEIVAEHLTNNVNSSIETTEVKIEDDDQPSSSNTNSFDGFENNEDHDYGVRRNLKKYRYVVDKRSRILTLELQRAEVALKREKMELANQNLLHKVLQVQLEAASLEKQKHRNELQYFMRKGRKEVSDDGIEE